MRLTIILVFLIGIKSFAGGTTGGGGKGVVCLDGQGNETVELLDLWEARVLFAQKPKAFPQGTTLQEATEVLIDRLQYVIPSGLFDNAEEIKFYKESWLREVGEFLNPAQSGSYTKPIFLSGVDLELTDDSFEVAKPTNCEIRQLVNYQAGGRVYLDGDRIQKMNLLNQASLYVHEVFYKFLRGFDDKNSIRTRRAIGFISAGNSFNDFPNLGRPGKYITCVKEEFEFGPAEYAIDILPVARPGYPGATKVLPKIVDHSPFLGILDWDADFIVPGLFATLQQYLSTGQCDGSWISSHKPFFVSGPVEFDRGFHLDLYCDLATKKLTTTVKSRRPGDEKWTPPVTLNCREAY